jgi:hypothetical protein
MRWTAPVFWPRRLHPRIACALGSCFISPSHGMSIGEAPLPMALLPPVQRWLLLRARVPRDPAEPVCRHGIQRAPLQRGHRHHCHVADDEPALARVLRRLLNSTPGAGPSDCCRTQRRADHTYVRNRSRHCLHTYLHTYAHIPIDVYLRASAHNYVSTFTRK